MKKFLSNSCINPIIYMKKKFENEEIGNGTSWKKELEAWILKWNILRSNKSC
jgi:hypothetical protein